MRAHRGNHAVAEVAHFLAHAALIGFGATVCMDVWWLLQKRVFGVPVLTMRWSGAGLAISHVDACATSPSRRPPR